MIVKTVKVVDIDNDRIVESEVIKATDNHDLNDKATTLLCWWKEARSNYCGYKVVYEN